MTGSEKGKWTPGKFAGDVVAAIHKGSAEQRRKLREEIATLKDKIAEADARLLQLGEPPSEPEGCYGAAPEAGFLLRGHDNHYQELVEALRELVAHTEHRGDAAKLLALGKAESLLSSLSGEAGK